MSAVYSIHTRNSGLKNTIWGNTDSLGTTSDSHGMYQKTFTIRVYCINGPSSLTSDMRALRPAQDQSSESNIKLAHINTI